MSETRAVEDEALREVAKRVAAGPVRFNGAGSTVWWVSRVPKPLNWPAGLFLALDGLVRTLPRLRPLLPNSSETVSLYRKATGRSRDQARADLGVVEDRLRKLTSVNDNPAIDAAAIERLALILIRWVASGRPVDDPAVARMERTFEELTNHELLPQVKVDRQASYRDARARYEGFAQACLELLGRCDDGGRRI